LPGYSLVCNLGSSTIGLAKRMKIFPLLLAFPFLGIATAPAATTRVVVYGDSGVAGKGVSPDQAYPAQLERMLRKKGHDVTVTNAGANGRTSADAVANLDASVPTNANVVIVQFGINDIKHGIDAARVRSNMDQVVSRLRARGAGVLVVGYPSADLSSVASAHGALYAQWGGLPDPKYHVPNDPNHHFNAAGLAVMASRMLPSVERLIGEAGKH
jgi:acyl-CoA thioesterase-1